MKYSNHYSTPIFKVAILLSVMVLESCIPQSKETYLERYKEFISDVSENYESYTEQDWEESSMKYERFSGEWYVLYEDEFTWKEQVLVGKYEIQYNLMKVKESSVNFFNTYMKEDYKKLKEQVEYYYKNDMADDIEFLLQQAKEIGDSAASIMNDIIEDLDINMDDLLK